MCKGIKTTEGCLWDGEEIVCSDSCIIHVIKIVQINGVKVLSADCGHGEVNPSVVIDECEDAEKTAELLKKHDPERILRDRFPQMVYAGGA